jgi:hypothetical protein
MDFIWIFGYVVSISSMFHFDLYKYSYVRTMYIVIHVSYAPADKIYRFSPKLALWLPSLEKDSLSDLSLGA